MIKSIKIRNIALIEELGIEFFEGLNIITGETGAGKSILLSAIGLILGEKITLETLRTGSKKGSVEVIFDISKNTNLKKILLESGIEIDEDLLIIKREIGEDSKSRSYINLNTVPNTNLKVFGEYLLDISGQHAHQSLLRPQVHIDLLDNFGGLIQKREQFALLFNRFKEHKRDFEEEKTSEEEKAKNNELNLFAIEEIDKSKPSIHEDTELTKELESLNNYEKLNTDLTISYDLIYQKDDSITSNTEKLISSLEAISQFDPKIEKAFNDAKEGLYIFENVRDVIRSYKDDLDYSPQRIEEINQRIQEISNLKKKYGSTINDILSYKAKCEKEVENYEQNKEKLEKLIKKIKQSEEQLSTLAVELSKNRQKCAKDIEKAIQKELSYLGMEKTLLKVEFRYVQDESSFLIISGKGVKIEEKGIDRVEFIFSANPGETPKPLIKIASGGELSRVMLAIKTILTEMDEIDTLLFDEVDAGIGGEMAFKVGKKIKKIAQKRQVLCITHSPQIASLSEYHYLVEKIEEQARTKTVIRKLDPHEKVKEVARMLSGENLTDLSLQHAKELIEKN